MTIAGSLIASVVHVSTPLTVAVGQATVSLQSDVLDVILRNLLPLALTLGAWHLLERRVSSMRLIGTLFLLGILATYAGLLGSAAPPLFSRAWVDFVTGGLPITLASLLQHLWPVLLAVAGGGLALVLVKRKTA
jgi:hypothetical protein